MSNLPSKQQILDWIADNPGESGKREIARAFGIKGAARIDLKQMLKEMEADGQIAGRRKAPALPLVAAPSGGLPPVALLEVLPPDAEGNLRLHALEWQGEGAAPEIFLVRQAGDQVLQTGDRILGRLHPVDGTDHQWSARLIRKIGQTKQKIVGVYRKTAEGGRILPIERGSDKEWRVAAGAALDAKDGELVEAEQVGPKGRLGLPLAKVTSRIGDPGAPKAVSLIAIHQHGIPDDFPADVIAEADAQAPAGLEGREDLTHLPLCTIDPPDARDHDDAVWAEADTDPRNEGGHIIWVAIADVAHYVRPGSALDREARLRGNSTYFPDRVVPMLPDRLSGDLCSLHDGVDRACLAVRMVIDSAGNKISHQFHRGLMRSVATLNYREVQEARDGAPNARCAPLMARIINPLYEAFAALSRARAVRQPLELDLPERKIILSEAGEVTSVSFAERLDAHRLIEEFMVLANVAAAEELIRRRAKLVFRVHEEPAPEKLEALREVARASGLTLAKGQVLHTQHLNRLLAQAAGTPDDELINISTLRSMQQAYYHPANYGHFGLALKSYAHFTSPIRRYSDLIVHRALISAHGWGKDGMSAAEEARLEETAEHISLTERRSMAAERDTTDRYLAAYLSERVGTEVPGRISGVQKFGIFVKLDETGADGLVPIRTLGREFFRYDAENQILTGSETGTRLGLGQRVLVRIAEAAPITGGLELELLEVEGEVRAASPHQARFSKSKFSKGKGGKTGFGRKPRAEKAGVEKAARKVIRKRK